LQLASPSPCASFATGCETSTGQSRQCTGLPEFRHSCSPSPPGAAHRGQPSPAVLPPFSFMFWTRLGTVKLTYIPVLLSILRTCQSAPCPHVRHCSSPVHVGSPPLTVSGRDSSTHGCASPPWSFPATSLPPAGTTVAGNRRLRRPLFFKTRPGASHQNRIFFRGPKCEDRDSGE
jgi:hypothetical protein